MKFVPTVIVSVAAAIALSTSNGAYAHGADGAHEQITPAFQTAIANVPGKTMTAVVVDYKPGGVSLPHRHGQAFVVGYVLQGAIRSKVDDGEARVYDAGKSWTEAPGAHHLVSENASKTKPARLLAIFVADDNDEDLVIWDKK